MNSFTLGIRTIGRRPLPAVLTVALLMFGISTVVVVLLFERALEDRLGRDARGVDLVVGAKGSGLQLVLSSVFHIDVPTGNVRLPELREIARHRMVAGVIPLSLGDAYRGFRIVGTTHAYPDLYGARLAQGRLWERSMEAVAGAHAARRTGLRTGDSFVGSHGLEGDSGFHHGEHPYRVVGVLRETGTVLDRLILVNSASVWEVHAVHGEDAAPARRRRLRDGGRRRRARAPAGRPGGDRDAGPLPDSARRDLASARHQFRDEAPGRVARPGACSPLLPRRHGTRRFPGVRRRPRRRLGAQPLHRAMARTARTALRPRGHAEPSGPRAAGSFDSSSSRVRCSGPSGPRSARRSAIPSGGSSRIGSNARATSRWEASGGHRRRGCSLRGR